MKYGFKLDGFLNKRNRKNMESAQYVISKWGRELGPHVFGSTVCRKRKFCRDLTI
jgi:hypothetical protein